MIAFLLAVTLLPAEECALCHLRIPAPGRGWSGEQTWIGPSALWPSSMMAYAGRDPYWKSRVEFERTQAPDKKEVIDELCTRCHTPARTLPASEGVTCTVCHQITPERLGQPASFTGGFQLGTEKRIFGPHDAPFTMPMIQHVQYMPMKGEQTLRSELCATCHTVITSPGQGLQFLEQTPYLEWLGSDYAAAGRTCQSCHMPRLPEPGQHIAHRPPGGPFPPTRVRSPFGRHEFAGSNVATLEKLGDAAGASRARKQLEGSLTLDVTAQRREGRLDVTVKVVNLAGHKLPTGFPSRRLWLHVKAVDEAGRVRFESGAPDRMPASFQPHYEVITNPSQAQIFEAEAVDLKGEPTASLLASARHRKDNRILPAGFRADRLDAAGLGSFGKELHGPVGSASTVYRIPLDTPGKFHVEVEALFQTAKPSYGDASPTVTVARRTAAF